jgi:porin
MANPLPLSRGGALTRAGGETRAGSGARWPGGWLRILAPLCLLPALATAWSAQCGGRGQTARAPQSETLCLAPWARIFGANTRFAKAGIDFEGWVQGDGATLASGGPSGARAFDGQYLLDLSATFDSAKLIGWPGGTLMLDVQTHSGPNVTSEYIPSFQDPDNMDAHAFTEIDRAWYRQTLWGRKLRLRAGLMYVDDQFFTVPYGGNFISLDFSSDASISTFVLPTYPKGAFGGDVFLYPGGGGSYVSAGVFNDHSTELPYDPGGDLWISEEGWRHAWAGRPFQLEAGAWRDTGRFRPLDGPPGAIGPGAWGEYMVAGYKLWQPPGSPARGVGVFVQLGAAPPEVAAVGRHVGAGIVWTGAWAARPEDEAGFAFSDGLLSPQAGFAYGFENEFEAYYQIRLSPALTVQPDVEDWQHPGGMAIPGRLLLSVRMQYQFP